MTVGATLKQLISQGELSAHAAELLVEAYREDVRYWTEQVNKLSQALGMGTVGEDPSR